METQQNKHGISSFFKSLMLHKNYTFIINNYKKSKIGFVIQFTFLLVYLYIDVLKFFKVFKLLW